MHVVNSVGLPGHDYHLEGVFANGLKQLKQHGGGWNLSLMWNCISRAVNSRMHLTIATN